MNQKEFYKQLIHRYVRNEATEDELEVFFELMASSDMDEELYAYLLEEAYNADEEKIVSLRRRWLTRIAVAAIPLILAAGGYFLLHKSTPVQQIVKAQKMDLLPGRKKAILLLSNGSQINLAEAKAGIIAKQGNTNISKTADNKIFYNNTSKVATEIAYNTIITKRGNYYPLTMSDGTVVILDAGSSIKYPVNFTGKERRVEITGQVYFEVNHNAKMPFRVSVKGQTIEDLGTHFNINAYDDEPNIKATLIEGSVRINGQTTLVPGQQAVITNGNIKIKKADIEQAIAWKKGLFNFNDMSIEQAMRQLSRWYDVDIEYSEELPKTIFHGEMHRNVNASQIFEVLRFFKVNFQIIQGSNGKKILVKP